jgi:hypothetical protein
VPPNLAGPSDKLFEEWNSHFPGSTKRENESVSDIVLRQSVSDNFDLLVKVKAFLKWEKDFKTTVLGASYTPPRLIQPFTALVRVATGLAICEIQEWFHKVLRADLCDSCDFGSLGNSRFCAGDNIDSLSAWFNQLSASCEMFGVNDMSCYDATFHEGCHDLMMEIYEIVGIGAHPWAQHFRPLQVNPIGRTRHGIEYRVPGTMRSGAADTCLANSVINILMHHFVIETLNPKVTRQEWLTTHTFFIAAMGDDSLLGRSKKVNVAGMDQLMLGLGFLPKLTWDVEKHDLVYLNMLPYPTDEGDKFGPLAGRLIARLGWSMEARPKPLPYLYGVFLAFRASCSHVPILRGFIEGVLAVLPKNANRGYQNTVAFDREFGHRAQFSDVSVPLTEQALEFSAARYGVTKQEISDLDNGIYAAIVGCDSASVVLSGTLLEHIVSTDI